MDSHSLAIELSSSLLWRRSKGSPLELFKGEAEDKPTIATRSLRRFSSAKFGRKGGDALEDKSLQPLKPTSVSVRVNVQGDDADEWSTLQGTFWTLFISSMCKLHKKSHVLFLSRRIKKWVS